MQSRLKAQLRLLIRTRWNGDVLSQQDQMGCRSDQKWKHHCLCGKQDSFPCVSL